METEKIDFSHYAKNVSNKKKVQEGRGTLSESYQPFHSAILLYVLDTAGGQEMRCMGVDADGKPCKFKRRVCV